MSDGAFSHITGKERRLLWNELFMAAFPSANPLSKNIATKNHMDLSDRPFYFMLRGAILSTEEKALGLSGAL
jgi:hypothetical protein